MEHVDFVNLNDIDFENIDVFEEVDAKQAHLKSKSSLRSIPAPMSDRWEKDFRMLDDHALFQLIVRHDFGSLNVLAFAIAIMQKRYSPNFVVHGG